MSPGRLGRGRVREQEGQRKKERSGRAPRQEPRRSNHGKPPAEPQFDHAALVAPAVPFM
jgi:hypothetical protein